MYFNIFSILLFMNNKTCYFNIINYFVVLRIIKGSVPEIRIWSILLIQSDLKWCIHLSRSLF